MEGLQEQLKRITDKLQQVVHSYQLLQKEHDQLSREVVTLRDKEKARLIRIDELEMKMAALQTVTGQLNDGEKKEVEKKLNRYIREIDRCIAMLGE